MEWGLSSMNKKMCVATWVYGRKYQGWIPLYVYSIKKNYPDYDIKIFLDKNLSIGIEKILKEFDLNKYVEIIENVIATNEYRYCNNIEKRCYRWLMNEMGGLSEYEFVYIGDIDIYITKEEVPLLEQHIKHLEQVNGVYSNAIRLTFRDYFSHRKIIDKSHLWRLTGLHFVKSKEYFKAVCKNQERIMKYLSGRRIKIVDKMFFGDDERCLWLLVTLSKIKYPGKSYELVKDTFRPLHGLHFAIGREFETYREMLNNNSSKFEEHSYYYSKFVSEYNSDVVLRKLIFSSSFYIINTISKTCETWKGRLNKDGIETK